MRRLPAFTLVELLTVIAIIAILCALIFPIVTHFQEQANSTRCTSNLGQIGAAIQKYATDNAEVLPGPLVLEQYPLWTVTSKNSLPQLLAPYLGIPENTASTPITMQLKSNVFVCPSYARQFPKLDHIVYAMNTRPIAELMQPPWGDTAHAPVRKGVLSSWVDKSTGKEQHVDLTQTFAMRDTDQKDSEYEGGTPAPTSDLAPQPVHGDHRNALYYDWHVAPMTLDDQTKNWVPPAP